MRGLLPAGGEKGRQLPFRKILDPELALGPLALLGERVLAAAQFDAPDLAGNRLRQLEELDAPHALVRRETALAHSAKIEAAVASSGTKPEASAI